MMKKNSNDHESAETCQLHLLPEIQDQDQLYKTIKTKTLALFSIFFAYILNYI